MNKEDPYRQITDKTRRRIEKSYNERVSSASELPPRTELHRQRRNKPKRKLKYPVIRLLALFFILVPITIFAIYTNRADNVPAQTEPAVDDDHEKISIDDSPEIKDDSKEKGSKSDVEKGAENQGGATNSETVEENVEQPVPPVVVPEEPGAGTVQGNPPESSEQPPVAAQNINNNKVIKHTVQPGENLFRIAMKYYHSQSGVAIIKKANNLTSDEIQLGQVLNIPL